MKAKINLWLYIGSLAVFLLVGYTANHAVMADDEQGISTTEFKEMLKDILAEEPEIIIEAFRLYQAKQDVQQVEEQNKALEIAQQVMETNAAIPALGAPLSEAKIILAEFFDYQCGFCKRQFPHIESLIETHDDLRVVMIEMPILGPASVLASKAAMAAARQDEYEKYHAGLMQSKGKIDDEMLVDLAKHIGLDIEIFNQDRSHQVTDRLIQQNIALAQQLGIQGTPAMILNKTILPGYHDEEQLNQMILDLKKQS